MKGAVLYKLGMDLVRERVLRRNYGTIMDMPFRGGQHPKERWILHFSGQARCHGVMYWFAKKVILCLGGLTFRVKRWLPETSSDTRSTRVSRPRNT